MNVSIILKPRITPAYAGKRSSSTQKCDNPRDHPRLRGEKSKNTLYRAVKKGSPPLTRGKVPPYHFFLCTYRITPAYAGKRERQTGDAGTAEDHPRLRGEKFTTPANFIPVKGSPPLTRGKVIIARSTSISLRITPAYAGKR